MDYVQPFKPLHPTCTKCNEAKTITTSHCPAQNCPWCLSCTKGIINN